MNANEMKHAAKLEEWTQRIMECRSSGLSVREWCDRNNWSKTTYYRWERELFRRIKSRTGAGTDLVVGSSCPPSRQETELVELPVITSEGAVSEKHEAVAQFIPVAVLRVGKIELELTNGISSRLVKDLKEILCNA